MVNKTLPVHSDINKTSEITSDLAGDFSDMNIVRESKPNVNTGTTITPQLSVTDGMYP